MTIQLLIEFQSPCGEKVLKVEWKRQTSTAAQLVSVPLRGKGFESTPKKLGGGQAEGGFSPLAGKRF